MHSRFHDGLFEKLSHTYCHSRVLFSQFVAILLDLILVDVVLKFTSSYFLSQFLKNVFGKYLFVYTVLFLRRIKFYSMLFFICSWYTTLFSTYYRSIEIKAREVILNWEMDGALLKCCHIYFLFLPPSLCMTDNLISSDFVSLDLWRS